MKNGKAATATRSKAITPEVIEPENPTVTLVKGDVSALTSWAGNMRQFFQQATDLEMAAKSRLVRMEGLKLPTNGAQDAQLQDLIRVSNDGKKEVVAHWHITSVADKLHKFFVAGRKRATDADEQATQIGNRLHATYVEQERRRAQEEEDRLRREAEERARRDRQAELDRLEKEALKAEAASPDLSEREELFIRFIDAGRTTFDAAKQAGYKDAGVMGPRLMSTAKILKAIEARATARQMREQATAIETAPVEIEAPTVRPDIQKGGDRTTYSADIFDMQALLNATLAGTHGIPTDILTVNPVKVNELARSLREQINRWPGVRLKKQTRVV